MAASPALVLRYVPIPEYEWVWLIIIDNMSTFVTYIMVSLHSSH